MEEILLKQLKNDLREYKEYMIYILIIFSLIIALMQFLYNLYLSKKIESFKNDLKKDEIKFNRHTEMQIECLKNLYSNVVDFHSNFLAFTSPKFFTQSHFKKTYDNLSSNFGSNMEYFHKNKILLTDEIINQIGVIFNKFKIIEKLYLQQLENLIEIEAYHESDDPQKIYGNVESEIDSIKKRLNLILETTEASTFEEEIKELRKLVENYFSKLTK